MQDQILQVDENMLETRLDRLVSEKVEQLLNAVYFVKSVFRV